jgi:hypothetical protein
MVAVDAVACRPQRADILSIEALAAARSPTASAQAEG